MESSLGTLAAMAASAFISATLWPMGSEFVFVGLLATTQVSPIALFVVATLANVGGATVNWLMGRALARTADGETGHRLLERFRLTDHRRAQAERLFERFGPLALIMSWAPIVGDPLTVVAGMLRYPLARFLLFVLIGRAARYGVLWAGLNGFEYLR